MTDYKATSYDKMKALFLGGMADLAYEPGDTIRKKLNGLKSKNIGFYAKHHTECFFSEFPDCIVASFRGTSSLPDFITDINVHLEPEGEFYAHGGFIKALDQVWDDLFFMIHMTYLDTKKPIYLTGHSLGGALAVLASCRLLELAMPHQVYTFGCPRVLSQGAAAWYQRYMGDLHHRYVNNNDVVPRVPPRLLGVSHVGKFHYFKEDGEQDDNITWFEKLEDRIEGRLKDIGELGTDGIKDHSMFEYLARLEKSSRL